MNHRSKFELRYILITYMQMTGMKIKSDNIKSLAEITNEDENNCISFYERYFKK